jgi:hypothetical protein
VIWLNLKIEKEKRRNRTVQAFLAGVIRAVSDYQNSMDRGIKLEDLPQKGNTLPIPYRLILDNIDCEFDRDTYLQHYEKWLNSERLLFFEDKKYYGGGFNFMYIDFFDRRLQKWNMKNDER